MSDDLTRIKDIGSAREKWLNDHGIDTYALLAKADSNWIFEQLKTEGKPSVPPEVIQCWIQEAITMNTETPATEPDTNPPIEQVTNIIPFQPQHLKVLTEDGWNDFATFYVVYRRKQHVEQEAEQEQEAKDTYRTVVYRTIADHIEGNEYEQWKGIEGDKLRTWILKHVDKIISNESPKEETRPDQPILTEQKPASGELLIERIEIQDDAGEIVSSTEEASFFQKVLSSQHPLTITPVLSVAPANAPAFTWKGKLSLYVSKMPRDRSIQESQQQALSFSNIADVHHRHSFQPICLTQGLYRIQVVLWTAEPSRKLAASKEYILQLI